MYKVVVVEDEKRVRQGIIMGTDWSKINCVVMGEAANGEEGVEMIRKCRPDIVITDIRMPGQQKRGIPPAGNPHAQNDGY